MSQQHSRTQTSAPNDDEIDLGQLFNAIWFHKWQISAVTAIFMVAGIIYALSSTPIYQADAMLEVTSKKNQVLGDLNDVLGGGQAPTDTDIELIKSRLILGKAVRDLGLEIVAKPKISRWEKPFIDRSLNRNISITHFQINKLWLNQPFKIITQGDREYKITTPDEQVLSGVVGQPLQIDAETILTIGKIDAPFGQEFNLVHYTELASIERVRKNLSVAAKGKNVPILSLTMTGENPAEIQSLLDRIIANYTAHSRDKDVQNAASGLKFINEELPKLETALQEAEDKLNNYRARSGSVDVPTEARGTLESLNKLEMQIVDLKTEESVLSEVYTKDHPAYRALRDKLKVLETAKERLNRQISRMPTTQQAIIRLTRDVEINQAIYVQLLNKKQELSILSASSQGNVNLIDNAMTAERPVKPKKMIIVALATILGLFASVGFFLTRALLHRGINSEIEIEALGLSVLGSIPKSDKQTTADKSFRKFRTNKNARANSLLAIKDGADPAIEALRALRTSLYFNALDAKNNVIMISGATAEVGKSFISANLATLMAQTGKKVLLIDGDMRKGYLHTLLQIKEQTSGLANILMDKNHKNYTANVQTTSIENLDFVSHGSNSPSNPSELLLGKAFPDFLTWAEKHYDFIILDTPPVLAVTDAAVMGQYVGTALLVSRFGQTALHELDASVARFATSKVQIDGVVLNGIERTAKNYYTYDNYAKQYQ